MKTVRELKRSFWAETLEKSKFTEPSQKLRSRTGFLYHATNTDHFWDMLSDGYVEVFPPDYGTEQSTWPDGSTESRSYWSADASAVWSFVPEGKGIIIRVPNSSSFQREVTGDWYTTRRIPVASVQVLVGRKWVPFSEVGKMGEARKEEFYRMIQETEQCHWSPGTGLVEAKKKKGRPYGIPYKTVLALGPLYGKGAEVHGTPRPGGMVTTSGATMMASREDEKSSSIDNDFDSVGLFLKCNR
jgi:hypothetical protein